MTILYGQESRVSGVAGMPGMWMAGGYCESFTILAYVLSLR
jgi:hypothetical protein